MEDKKVNIFSDPSEIDAVIKSRINSFCNRGGKRSSAWTEDEIQLRDGVIWEYMVKQGLSREATAQQIAVRWDITPGTARKYVVSAIKNLANSFRDSEDLEEIKRMYLQRIEGVLQTALDRGALDSSIKALDLYGKSLGFFNEKKDLTLGGDLTISFDFT